jgi:hypothetical protein
MQQERSNKIHTIALNTNLFKGRVELYYCYLKSEKIALAIARIFSDTTNPDQPVLNELLRQSRLVPEALIQLAAGAVSQAAAIAAIFKARTLTDLAVSSGLLSADNGGVLLEEYANIIDKIGSGATIPALTLADITMPEFPRPAAALPENDKRHIKGHQNDSNKRHNSRPDAILKVINENKRVSIKDISRVVRDCSEKTIQRELNNLMRQGFVRKEGERRWSTYLPTTNN